MMRSRYDELSDQLLLDIDAFKRLQITNQLANAQIIEDTEEYQSADCSKVFVGAIVGIKFDDELDEYQIVGQDGDVLNNKISCESPLAKILIGKELGDKFDFNEFKVEVVSIRK